MSCFMPVGDVMDTSLPCIRSLASSRVLSARSFPTSPLPFRTPATQGRCSIEHKCCNICWSEPCVTILGSCLVCVTTEGEITWWAPRHDFFVGEVQSLFFSFSPSHRLMPSSKQTLLKGDYALLFYLRGIYWYFLSCSKSFHFNLLTSHTYL